MPLTDAETAGLLVERRICERNTSAAPCVDAVFVDDALCMNHLFDRCGFGDCWCQIGTINALLSPEWRKDAESAGVCRASVLPVDAPSPIAGLFAPSNLDEEFPVERKDLRAEGFYGVGGCGSVGVSGVCVKVVSKGECEQQASNVKCQTISSPVRPFSERTNVSIPLFDRSPVCAVHHSEPPSRAGA